MQFVPRGLELCTNLPPIRQFPACCKSFNYALFVRLICLYACLNITFFKAIIYIYSVLCSANSYLTTYPIEFSSVQNMRFLKWRHHKKAKPTQQNGHRSHSPINPITIVGALSTPASNTLAPTMSSNVIEDDNSSGPYAPSQSTTIAAQSQITAISTKRNGDASRKPKRKTSRVSFQLGPAIVPNDLPPHKSQSECGTVSSARFPKPNLKTGNLPAQQSNKQPPPIIENFDFENYIAYVIKVNTKKTFKKLKLLNSLKLIIKRLADRRLDPS